MVLAGHKHGLDDLDTRLAFITIERLLIEELRSAHSAIAIIRQGEDENGDPAQEWADQVAHALYEAAEEFELDPTEKLRRRQREIQEFIEGTDQNVG